MAHAPVKVLVIADRYGDYPLLNHMVLGLPSRQYSAKVCYLRGVSDGKNRLDSHGRSIYLQGNGRLGIIASLVRVLKRESPRILHCHRHRATVYGTIAARLSGVPVVISHSHGTPAERLWRRPGRRFIYRWVDRIITVSEAAGKDILSAERLEPEKVVTVRNGIDIGRFERILPQDAAKRNPGIPAADFVYGTVGRLQPVKGHSCLLDAFAEVLKRKPQAYLVIVGDGALRKALEDKARSLGVFSRVLFLGYRRDIPELLAAFDVFVFPSLREGLPLALLEAMASRLPVVVSDAGGIRDVFGGGGFGRMFPAGNASALAEAMMEVATLSGEERLRMGEKARKRVEEEFTKDAMCKSIMDIYGELLRRGV
jgi:glycosyltransferase involved in cell wall biosynthesis